GTSNPILKAKAISGSLSTSNILLLLFFIVVTNSLHFLLSDVKVGFCRIFLTALLELERTILIRH
ncbi:MAG: hypothetical protein WBE61_08070, partial [Nitrososphaeraceae archaeon]